MHRLAHTLNTHVHKIQVNLKCKQPLKVWGWRDGLVAKSIGCSSRGTRFNSQQPHGTQQPPVTPALGGIQYPFLASPGHGHFHSVQTCTNKTAITRNANIFLLCGLRTKLGFSARVISTFHCYTISPDLHVIFFFFWFFFFSELGTEPRALRFLGKRSTTELNPQPLHVIF